MKLILILLALFFSFNASAQAPQPSCKVGIDGKLAPYMPRYVKGNSGEHVYYWCVRPDGITETNGFSCPFTIGECGIGAFASRMAAIMTAADRPAAAASAWASAFAYACSSEIRAENSDRGRMCTERSAILDANYATWTAGLVQPVPPPTLPNPPVYTHAVKANGLVTTRPAYILTDGVRGTKEVARATVGQPCDLTKPTLASGSDVWAIYGPEFAPGRVALCAATR